MLVEWGDVLDRERRPPGEGEAGASRHLPCSSMAPPASWAFAIHSPAPFELGATDAAHEERVILLSIFAVNELPKQLVETGKRYA